MKVLFVRPTSLDIIGLTDSVSYPIAVSMLGHDVSMVIIDSHNPELPKSQVKYVFAKNRLHWYILLFQTISKFKPDIVHVFPHLGCGLYPLLTKLFAYCPKFVLDIRSPLLSTGLRRYITQAKNQLEVSTYNGITAHSITSAWTVVGKHPSINWTPPGVFLKEIPEKHIDANSYLKTPPIKMVYIGSLNKNRHLEIFINSISIVSKERSILLDIYGSGDDRENIIREIEMHNLESVVTVKSAVSQTSLFHALINYDIGLSFVPSSFLFDTAPPLKTLEYLAVGLLVIATNTTGNRMLIRDGENGILGDDTPLAFADVILRVVSDPVFAYSLAQRARQSVLSFDWVTLAKDRLIPFYESILSN